MNEIEISFVNQQGGEWEIGDTILVKGFTNSSSNGIYKVVSGSDEIPRMPE